jgi:hypothetical protein
MNANPSPGTMGNESGDCVRRATAFLALVLLVSGARAAEQEQTPAPEQTAQIPAVLKLHEINFSYRSHAAPFSCLGLEGRIASILRYLGARDDVQVKVTGCEQSIGTMEEPDVMVPLPSSSDRSSQYPSERWRTMPNSGSSSLYRRDRTREPSAYLRVRVMIPVEVTPEVLAELKKDKSRRELAARVSGNKAGLDDPIVFPAERQQVKLSRHTVKLEPEDCELIQEMSSSVFPKLGMRMVRRPSCDRDEVSRIYPEATIDALMPVMPKGPEIKLAPEEPGTAAPAPSAPAPAAPAEMPPAEPATPSPPR